MGNSGIQFTNTVHDTKELNILNYRNFYNGGGVAVGDINNDGLPDVVELDMNPEDNYRKKMMLGTNSYQI